MMPINNPVFASAPRQNKSGLPYCYHNVPVPGGGFVTGFVFHPTTPNILYCRTDIGGLYRYNFEENRWISLVDHVTDPGKWESYPLAVALDRQHPSYVYAAVGDRTMSKIVFSDDYGAHWQYLDVPCKDGQSRPVWIHGNAPGRSTGERLAVDPDDADTLYLATMEDGLFKTTDRCKTWKKLCVAFPGTAPEKCFTLIETVRLKNGVKLLVAGTSGEGSSPDGNARGQSLFVSADGGAHFYPVSGEPKPVRTGGGDHPGYVAQRIAQLGNFIYVTYAAYNVGWSGFSSCGCDLGLCYDGALMRYLLDGEGQVRQALDLTPPVPFYDDGSGRRIGCGLGGICADYSHPGTLYCSTVTRKPDIFFYSTDFGERWKPFLSGLEIGKIHFTVPYMKPEYSGEKTSCVHWPSDFKLNPFDSGMAVFNSGIGIFMTRDLENTRLSRTVTFETANEGVEETVHLNVYCPPSGDVQVIDVIGDYGGFVFTDIDRPAENTFANENHDRWITLMNADYAEQNPQLLIGTARGNWTGETHGGLILSHNQGRDWRQSAYPRGLTPELDGEVEKLLYPNVTAGWAAVSAGGETLVWTVGAEMKSSCAVCSTDLGQTWAQCKILDLQGNPVPAMPFKVLSDRVNPSLFYGFGCGGGGARIFASSDGGATFRQVPTPSGFPDVTLSGIDSEQFYELRVEPGQEGVVYAALNEQGLWRLAFDAARGTLSGGRVSAPGDTVKRIGFGKPLGGEGHTLYTSGTIGGSYGFFRSHDGGASWVRINDDAHQFGDIRSIDGDKRVVGRFFIATGTRGLVCGEPAPQQ